MKYPRKISEIDCCPVKPDPKAARIIERRTGYPKGLLSKTGEVIKRFE